MSKFWTLLKHPEEGKEKTYSKGEEQMPVFEMPKSFDELEEGKIAEAGVYKATVTRV